MRTETGYSGWKQQTELEYNASALWRLSSRASSWISDCREKCLIGKLFVFRNILKGGKMRYWAHFTPDLVYFSPLLIVFCTGVSVKPEMLVHKHNLTLLSGLNCLWLRLPGCFLPEQGKATSLVCWPWFMWGASLRFQPWPSPWVLLNTKLFFVNFALCHAHVWKLN